MARGKEFRSGRQAEGWSTNGCSTGKRGWPTRRAAKDANRKWKRQGSDLMSPYFHDECGTWHVGHLAPQVKSGLIGREEFYGRSAA